MQLPNTCYYRNSLRTISNSIKSIKFINSFGLNIYLVRVSVAVGLGHPWTVPSQLGNIFPLSLPQGLEGVPWERPSGIFIRWSLSPRLTQRVKYTIVSFMWTESAPCN